MYNPQITVVRIKELLSSNGVSLKEVNDACGLNKNTIAVSANSKTGLNAKALFDISTELNCSVDYLLGRTDSPNITSDTYINGNNNGIQAISNGDNSKLTVNGSAKSNTDTDELVELIQGLPLVQRAKIITQIDEMKNKK